MDSRGDIMLCQLCAKLVERLGQRRYGQVVTDLGLGHVRRALECQDLASISNAQARRIDLVYRHGGSASTAAAAGLGIDLTQAEVIGHDC